MEIEYKEEAPTPAIVGYRDKVETPYFDCLRAAVSYALKVIALEYGEGAYAWCIDDQGAINIDHVREDVASDVTSFLIAKKLILPEVSQSGEAIVPVLSYGFSQFILEAITIELFIAKMTNHLMQEHSTRRRELVPILRLPVDPDVVFPVGGGESDAAAS